MAKLKEALLKSINDSPRVQELDKEYPDLKVRPGSDISCLDPLEGMRFRGKTVPETLAALPKHPGREYPSLESFYWFLLTGRVPTEEEARDVIEDFKKRRTLPNYVVIVLRALPRDTHPLTMFSAAIFSMQRESVFVKRYNGGLKRDQYWDPMYEDCTDLLAKLPTIAAYIYRMKYKGDIHIPSNQSLDFGGNFAWQMGIPEPYDDAARMYFILHADHESGTASENAGNPVASSLSDAYYALCASINGLAGPLHGLKNQEVLRWIINVRKEMGGRVPTEQEMQKFVLNALESGQGVPGYGHAVLRKTDPRYMAQREFCLKNLPDDPIFQYVDMLYKVVPPVLEKQGKAKNPWPNVDAQSGVVQWHYGLTEWDFHGVLFAIARAVGVVSRIIRDCALGYPIENRQASAGGIGYEAQGDPGRIGAVH